MHTITEGHEQTTTAEDGTIVSVTRMGDGVYFQSTLRSGVINDTIWIHAHVTLWLRDAPGRLPT